MSGCAGSLKQYAEWLEGYEPGIRVFPPINGVCITKEQRECLSTSAFNSMLFWEQSAWPDPTWVYCIRPVDGRDETGERAALGPTKIGFAKDPCARLRNLQTAHPTELEVREVVLANRRFEHFAHHRYRHLRARAQGEWFIHAQEPNLFESELGDAAAAQQIAYGQGCMDPTKLREGIPASVIGPGEYW